MNGAIRLARVVVILLLALFAVSAVVGIGSDQTGAVEKAALVVLFAGCVVAAALVTRASSRLQARLQRH